MVTARLQFGSAENPPMQTVEAPAVRRPLGWHDAGKTWTASGYGTNIATVWCVLFANRWRRVSRTQYGPGDSPEYSIRLDGERVVVGRGPLSLFIAEAST